MYLTQLGVAIRRARKARGLTQATLSNRAAITRETLSQLESGAVKDLGIVKILRILRILDLELRLMDEPRSAPDYVRFSAVAGSTGFREPLSEEEILHALLTGKAPLRKKPHLRRLLEDSPPQLIQNLISQVSSWTEPDKLHEKVATLAKSLDVELRPEWMNRD